MVVDLEVGNIKVLGIIVVKIMINNLMVIGMKDISDGIDVDIVYFKKKVVIEVYMDIIKKEHNFKKREKILLNVI